MAGLAVSLSSCVESENPLSDPATCVADPDLYGTWSSVGDPQYSQIVVIGRPGRFRDGEALLTLKNVPAGMMRYAQIETGPNRSVNEAGSLDFFVTKIRRDSYVNLISYDQKPWPEVGEEGLKAWTKERIAGYVIAKYQVAGDKLTIWEGDRTALLRRLRTGNSRAKWGRTKSGKP